MIINRILTNNAIVVGQGNQEKILCGKGIGYKMRKGDTVKESLVTQYFVLNDDTENNSVEELVREVPLRFIDIADNIRKSCELAFGKNFNNLFVLTLADHIHGAIARLKKNIKINNLLTYDIQRYYSLEFEIAQKATKKISDEFNMEIPIDEAGFIALHIVNEQFDNTSNLDNAYRITKMIQDVLTVVKYNFSVSFDSESVYYYRFITHLKFFAYRLLNNVHSDTEVDDDLYQVIEQKFPDALDCAQRISDFIELNYHTTISKDELCYLSIHIHRLLTRAIK